MRLKRLDAAEWAAEQARRAAEAIRRAIEWAAEQAKLAAQWVMRQTVGRLLTLALNQAGTAAGYAADGGGIVPFSALLQFLDPVWKALGLEFPRYYTWQQYTVPDAVCGNGTPYKIFVNRSMVTTKTLFVMEGGGACWKLEDCLAKSTTTANPNGIRDNYMSVSSAVWDLVFNNGQTMTHDILNGIYGPLYALGGNPLMTRVHILGLGERVETQKYNMVYMPYCTGDVHSGNTVRVYSDDQGESRVQHFKGALNAEKVAIWAKNNLGQSLECKQWRGTFAGDLICWVGTEVRAWIGLGSDNGRMETMVVQGSSAGGFGTMLNYSTFREIVQPRRGVMLDDSGMPYDVVNPQVLSKEAYQAEKERSPFRVFADLVFNEWGGLKADGSGLFNKLQNRFAGIPFDPNRLSSVIHATGRKYPQDNFLYMMNRGDTVIPGFANAERISQNKFSPDYKKWGDAGITDKVKAGSQEMDKLVPIFNTAPPNVGYYFPYGRSVFGLNHTLIMGLFAGTQTHTASGLVYSVKEPIDHALAATDSGRRMYRVLTTDTNYVDASGFVFGALGKVIGVFQRMFHAFVPVSSDSANVPAPNLEGRKSLNLGSSPALCVDVSGWGKNDGASLILWGCHGGLNQKFTLTSTGFLVGADSNKCLIPKGEALAQDTPIVLGNCMDQAAYKWIFFEGSFKNQAGDFVMGARESKQGSPLVLQAKQDGNRAQVFCLDSACPSGQLSQPDPNLVINGNGTITSIASVANDRCFDASSQSDGASVYLGSCHGGRNQQWKYMPNGHIIDSLSGKCLTPNNHRNQTANQARLTIWPCDDHAGAKWKYQGGKLYNLSKGFVVYRESNGTNLNLRPSPLGSNPDAEMFVMR